MKKGSNNIIYRIFVSLGISALVLITPQYMIDYQFFNYNISFKFQFILLFAGLVFGFLLSYLLLFLKKRLHIRDNNSKLLTVIHLPLLLLFLYPLKIPYLNAYLYPVIHFLFVLTLIVYFLKEPLINYMDKELKLWSKEPADIELFFRRLSFYLFIIIFALITLTLTNYGQNWDDGQMHRYGRLIIDYFKSLGKDKTVLITLNWFYYGGFFEAIVEILRLGFTYFGIYEFRHFFCALSGIIGIAAAYKIGKLFGGSIFGFFAALALLLLPGYYGQLFNNSKDIPFAAGYLWSIYFIIKYLYDWKKFSWKDILLLGLAFGSCWGIRVGGVVILPITFISLLLKLIQEFINSRKTRFDSLIGFVKKTAITFSIACFIGFIIMLLFWPYGQQNPLQNPFIALQYFSHFTGQSIKHPLINYILPFLLKRLPELMILSLIIGIGLTVYYLTFRRNNITKEKVLGILFLFLSVILPLLYIDIQNSFLYQEIRQLIFLQSVLAVLSGIVLGFIFVNVYRKGIAYTSVFVGIVTAFYLFLVTQMIILHPFEYIYYNQISGGIKAAYQRNDPLEYYLNAVREASIAFKKYVMKRDGNSFFSNTYKVGVLDVPTPDDAGYYFNSDRIVASSFEKSDYILATGEHYWHERRNLDEEKGFEVLFTIKRMGVPVARVYYVHK